MPSFLRRRGRLALLILLGGLALLAFMLRPPLPPLEGRGRVGDGDSFRLGEERLRLSGIDAPEYDQSCGSGGDEWPCGRAARDALATLLAAGDIHCRPEGRDRYGRMLATCQVEGRDIGEAMVEQGLALSTGPYWRQEASARAANLGLWRGGFIPPAEWRREQAGVWGMFRWFW